MPPRLLPLVLGASLSAALAAPIRPGWTDATEPRFEPGSTMWMVANVKAAPVVYRRVVTVPDDVAWVAGRLRATGCAYVWVDGELVAELADRPARRDSPAYSVPWPVDLDLTPDLPAGRHVLAISSTAAGIDLELVVHHGDEDARMGTDPSWRVQKLAPLTMLGREPCLSLDFDDSAWFATVADGDGTPVTAAEAAAVAAAARAQRVTADRDEARWRLQMLAERGWAIRDWQTRGFSGPDRWRDPLLGFAALPDQLGDDPLGAADALAGLAWLLDERTLFGRLADHYAASGQPEPAALAQQGAGTASAAVAHLRRGIGEHDWSGANLAVDTALADLGRVREQLRAVTGQPVNLLDRGDTNKCGWVDLAELMGSHLAEWGLRVNPVEVSWRLDLAGRWRFRLDPENRGLADTVQTPGYNIENQWDSITVPGPWEEQGYQGPNPRFPGDNPFTKSDRTDGPYNGYAWYRKTFHVPAEWAGHDLELAVGVIDDFDWTWFNGDLVGSTGRDQERWWVHPRVYRIAKEQVRFGQYNVIAVRVYDEADKGGIVAGPVELRCPDLRDAFAAGAADRRPHTMVYESPLSPAALLTVGGNVLTLSGWAERAAHGPASVTLTVGGEARSVAVTGDGAIYDRERDGPLGANWLCLWPAKEDLAGGELPLELVLAAPPRRIEATVTDRGVAALALRFEQAGEWVVALRPLRDGKSLTDAPDAHALERCAFWSKAVLAYPTDYTEVDERDGEALKVTDLYTYRTLTDAWGTQPLQVASLPPLACYAQQVKLPGFSIGGEAKPLDLGLGAYGELLGRVGADRVEYTVPVDRLPRLAGFTDFCFGPTDLGGPGNLAEVRLMQAVGCNSWRPQSNDFGERMHRAIELANSFGLALMVNVDNQRGIDDAVFEQYRGLAAWVMDHKLPAEAVAYDLINEPANMTPEVYNPRIARLVETIREVDPVHPIYIETPHSYAAVSQFVNLAPVDDERVVYSFHDYTYRLVPRWPNPEHDRRSLLRQWLPALRYGIAHHAPIHLGEFGAFHQTPHDPWHNRSTLTMLDDMFTIFDQYGWHFHYYSNRGEWTVRADGSLDGNLVHTAFARYFRTAGHAASPARPQP